jgi:hypothetical protein
VEVQEVVNQTILAVPQEETAEPLPEKLVEEIMIHLEM